MGAGTKAGGAEGGWRGGRRRWRRGRAEAGQGQEEDARGQDVEERAKALSLRSPLASGAQQFHSLGRRSADHLAGKPR